MKKNVLVVLFITVLHAAFGQCVTPVIGAYAYGGGVSCSGLQFDLYARDTLLPHYQWQWQDTLGAWHDHVDGIKGATGSKTWHLNLEPPDDYPSLPWLGIVRHRIMCTLEDTACVYFDSVTTTGIFDNSFIETVEALTPTAHLCSGYIYSWVAHKGPNSSIVPQNTWTGYQWQWTTSSGTQYLFHPSQQMTDTLRLPVTWFGYSIVAVGIITSGCGWDVPGLYFIADTCAAQIAPPTVYDTITIVDSISRYITTYVDTGHTKDSTVIVYVHDTLPVYVYRDTCLPTVTIYDTTYVVVNLSDGTTDTISKNTCRLGLYPNPTSDILNVYSPDPGISTFDVLVFDMRGRQVMPTFEMDSSPDSIHVGDLAPAAYLIELRSGHKRWVCTFVVQK